MYIQYIIYSILYMQNCQSDSESRSSGSDVIFLNRFLEQISELKI